MNETFYIVKQNITGSLLLRKPNKILFTTKNRKEAEAAFAHMTDGKHVHPYEFEKGVYVLLSEGHYIYHPKALYIINSNTYKV